MAAISTPTGMQSGVDATELTFNPGHNRPWEQNGVARTAGYIDQSLNQDANFTWKKARSDDNRTNHSYGPY